MAEAGSRQTIDQSAGQSAGQMWRALTLGRDAGQEGSLCSSLSLGHSGHPRRGSTTHTDTHTHTHIHTRTQTYTNTHTHKGRLASSTYL